MVDCVKMAEKSICALFGSAGDFEEKVPLLAVCWDGEEREERRKWLGVYYDRSGYYLSFCEGSDHVCCLELKKAILEGKEKFDFYWKIWKN